MSFEIQSVEKSIHLLLGVALVALAPLQRQKPNARRHYRGIIA